MPARNVPDRHDRFRSFLALGTRFVGNTTGGVIDAAGGGSILGAGTGAVLADVFERVALDIYDRPFAQLQTERAAYAASVAYRHIQERMDEEDPLRQDGWLTIGRAKRADAADLLEGTLLTAANAWDERKVVHIGLIFGNYPFEPAVSAPEAIFLVRLAEQLTYRQLAILAFVAASQTGGRYETELATITGELAGTGRQPRPDVLAEMNDLTSRGLLGLRDEGGRITTGIETWGGDRWRLSILPQAALMPVGTTLYRLMELQTVPGADQDDLLGKLRGET